MKRDKKDWTFGATLHLDTADITMSRGAVTADEKAEERRSRLRLLEGGAIADEPAPAVDEADDAGEAPVG